MKSRDFPLAVRKAFGGSLADDNVIPCLTPYSNMNLLQFVNAKNLKPLQVKRLFRSHSIKVLNSSGVSTETLDRYADNERIKSDLQVIVDNATTQRRVLPTISTSRDVMIGVFMAIEDQAGVTKDTGIGVKIKHDKNWRLSSGIVVKKATSGQLLRQILDEDQATFNAYTDLIHGVVTAIYFVQGPFSFTRTTNVRVGLQFDPAFAPGNIRGGINWNFNEEGDIVVTADDGGEWIIAIELSECELRQGNRLPHQQAAENGIVRNEYKLATIILAMAIFLPAWMTCFGLPWLSLGRLGLPSIIPSGS